MLFFIDPLNLVMPDLLGSRFFGHFSKAGTELVDMPGAGVDGVGGKVADLHVLGHADDVRIPSAVERCHVSFSRV